jgi:anti-anti-sigma factor
VDHPHTITDDCLALDGHLDGRRSAEVREALYAHIDRHPEGDVVVDLSGVESVDVTTMRLLAAASLKVEREGRRLVLRDCSPALRRAVAYIGWRRLFVLERSTTLPTQPGPA